MVRTRIKVRELIFRPEREMRSVEWMTLAFWGGWKGLGIALGMFWLAGLFDRLRRGYSDLLTSPRSLFLHALLPFPWVAWRFAPLDERAKCYAAVIVIGLSLGFVFLYVFASLAREREERPPVSGVWLIVLAALALPAMLWIAAPRVVQVALLIPIYGLALSPVAQAGWCMLKAISSVSKRLRWRIAGFWTDLHVLLARGRVAWSRIKGDKAALLSWSNCRFWKAERDAQSALFELGAGRELIDKIKAQPSGYNSTITLHLIQERRDAQFTDWAKEALFGNFQIVRSAAVSALEAVEYQPDWSAAGILFRIVKPDGDLLPGPGTKTLRLDRIMDFIPQLSQEERQRAFAFLKAIASVSGGIHKPRRFLEKLKAFTAPEMAFGAAAAYRTVAPEIACDLALHSDDAGLRQAILDWLLAILRNRSREERRNSALCLVRLYHEGALDEPMKQRILAHKSEIAEPHDDRVSTNCRMEGGRWYSYGTDHVDFGIGVTFDP